MATGKKYFWLKMERFFLKRHDIKYLKSQPRGYEIALYYIGLMLESIDHDGRLRFSEELPYTDDMLAALADYFTKKDRLFIAETNVLLANLGLLQRLEDGTIFLPEAKERIGVETDWAKAKREQREPQNDDEKTNDGQGKDIKGQCPLEIRDKSIDIRDNIKDKSLNDLDNKLSLSISTDDSAIKTTKIDYQAIMLYWNEHSKLKDIMRITDKRKEHLNARIKEYGLDKIFKMIDNVGKSSFLRGTSTSNFVASFDWCILPNNFIKVVEGNFLDGNKRAKEHLEDKTIYNGKALKAFYDSLDKK